MRTRPTYPDAGNAFCFQVEDGSFWFHHRNACILGAVRRFPPAGPVFDIGGGNGFVARGLVQQGFPAVVVEPGPEGARNARSRGLDPVVCAALDDAGFRPGALPAAGLFDVLEHLDDDVDVLRRLGVLVAPAAGSTSPCRRTNGCGRTTTICRSTAGATRCRACAVSPSAPGSRWSTPPTCSGRCRRQSRCCGCCRRAWGCARRPTRPPSRTSLQPTDGVAVRVLSRVLAGEAGWLARGGSLPFGGSCLMVARRA